MEPLGGIVVCYSELDSRQARPSLFRRRFEAHDIVSSYGIKNSLRSLRAYQYTLGIQTNMMKGVVAIKSKVQSHGYTQLLCEISLH
jgi:hypothetical protein